LDLAVFGDRLGYTVVARLGDGRGFSRMRAMGMLCFRILFVVILFAAVLGWPAYMILTAPPQNPYASPPTDVREDFMPGSRLDPL
jgi:hypothetical protein